MKHISAGGLDRIDSLLESIRQIHADGLKEKKRGAWYRKSKTFLHFHEDPAGIFADLKHDDGIFHRFAVNTAVQHASFLRTLRGLLAS